MPELKPAPLCGLGVPLLPPSCLLDVSTLASYVKLCYDALYEAAAAATPPFGEELIACSILKTLSRSLIYTVSKPSKFILALLYAAGELDVSCPPLTDAT